MKTDDAGTSLTPADIVDGKLHLGIGVERVEDKVCVVVRATRGEEFRIYVPLNADAARQLAAQLFEAANALDPEGKKRMLQQLLEDAQQSAVLAALPTDGESH